MDADERTGTARYLLLKASVHRVLLNPVLPARVQVLPLCVILFAARTVHRCRVQQQQTAL
jgi:hypothetical protein